ncbi:chitin synthase-domain-containing protein [Chytriomyces sp. MP71]|nr:chitin synthase-domain-containing protein [Chytriomyces sp. MP71]
MSKGGDKYLPQPTLPQIDDSFLYEDEIADLSYVLRDIGPAHTQTTQGTQHSGLSTSALVHPSALQSEHASHGFGSFTADKKKEATLPNTAAKVADSPYDQLQYVSLGRKKTLTKPARRPSDPEAVFNSINRRKTLKKRKEETVKTNTWVYASWVLTCCIPTVFIRRCLGKSNPLVQQAYREKVALCIIIFLLMSIVGFLTFGFQIVVCPKTPINYTQYSNISVSDISNVAIHGNVYSPKPGAGTVHPAGVARGWVVSSFFDNIVGADVGLMFPPARGTGACAAFDQNVWPLIPCTAFIPSTQQQIWPNKTITSTWSDESAKANATRLACHSPVDLDSISKYMNFQGVALAGYSDLKSMSTSGKKVMIFSSFALDVSAFFDPNTNTSVFGPQVKTIVLSHVGKDATRAFASAGLLQAGQCLSDYLKIAQVDSVTPSCLVSSIIVWVSLVIILAVVLARFVLALYFTYVIGWRLGSNKAYRRAMDDLKRRRQEVDRSGDNRGTLRRNATGRRVPVPALEGDIQPYNPNLASYVLKANQADSVHTQDSSSDSFDKSQLNMTTRTSTANPRSSAMPGKLVTGSTVGVTAFSESRFAARERETRRDEQDPSRTWNANFGFMEIDGPALDAQTSELLNDPTLMHTLCMVTAYSEGEGSLRGTLDSIANSYYPGTHKCLFVVADGIVKGSENTQTTPDILIDMIEVDERFQKDDPKLGGDPVAYSYVAIADGANRKNYAKVYAGWYKFETNREPAPIVKKSKKARFAGGKKTAGSAIEMDELAGGEGDADSNEFAHMRTIKKRSQGRVPMMLIVKVGNDDERNPRKPAAKPGNRGKRDSQVLLMNFLAKVMFDDRMTELEFDIFFKLFTITGVNPEKYEAVLMVDADTRIYPDAVSHMIACLLKDDRVMGLCGETKISNKWDSWVTMIQVFEYFISHHMTKSFESVFGGCTCLPGCFSMYRIKTPKGPNGYWVPILANPDVVEEYSEHIVDSLHKKNLLLLGEDRFLSTMMLRTFPKRRMVFVPQAICKTMVPDTFKVLLSQRRRWINSTIHNLMELLLVKDLCGTFCISMQFVIFMELVGTVVLPAAITFTLTIVVITFAVPGANTQLPLILLALILGLPAILILFTANRPIYIFWMLIYLISLPVWNFVLPVYAFWHFDDFSWGATRKVAGEVAGHDHSARDGEFDGKGINMKRWSEWVKVRRQEHERMEYARDPVSYENKRRQQTMASSGFSDTGSYRFSTTGGGTMRDSLSMPPLSFFTPGPPPPGLIPPPGMISPPGMMPPPGMIAPAGMMMPGPPPPGLLMPGPPPPGLIMPYMGPGIDALATSSMVASPMSQHPYFNPVLGNSSGGSQPSSGDREE